MASSKTLARLTEELLANASLGEEEINAIEKLLDGLIGGKCRYVQPLFATHTNTHTAQHNSLHAHCTTHDLTFLF